MYLPAAGIHAVCWYPACTLCLIDECSPAVVGAVAAAVCTASSSACSACLLGTTTLLAAPCFATAADFANKKLYEVLIDTSMMAIAFEGRSQPGLVDMDTPTTLYTAATDDMQEVLPGYKVRESDGQRQNLRTGSVMNELQQASPTQPLLRHSQSSQ